MDTHSKENSDKAFPAPLCAESLWSMDGIARNSQGPGKARVPRCAPHPGYKADVAKSKNCTRIAHRNFSETPHIAEHARRGLAA